jgi:hypothetical protein
MLATGRAVADGAGGIGCGMERSGVFDGWENGRPKGGRVRLEKRSGATGAADAASLGLCGGLGLTRCGAMEEALTWAWCSGGGLAMAE